MRKLRYRGFKQLVSGHQANKWQTWGFGFRQSGSQSYYSRAFLGMRPLQRGDNTTEISNWKGRCIYSF